MKRQLLYVMLILFVGIFVACTPEPETEIVVVEITRVVSEITEVEVTRLVEIEAVKEVTRIVEVPVEVTRLAEVTREVEVTRAVSDDATEAGNVEKPTSPDGLLEIGEEGRDGEQIYIVKEWSEAYSIPSDRGGEVVAPEGGKFIVAKVDFFNDGFDSDDIYCSWDFGMAVFDDRGREFDHTGRSEIIDLYHIEGNAGCNDMLQPGFSYENQTIAFLLPEDAMPAYLKLWDPNQLPERSDSFGEDSSARYRLSNE